MRQDPKNEPSRGCADPAAPLRAVVVEDHPLARRAIIAVLRQAGIEVVGEASDGSEAIDLVCREQPAVVVMDVELPVLSGIAAIRELHHLVPAIPVVALTMHDDPITVAECRAAGARGLISKNEDAAHLVGVVARIVAGDSVWPTQLEPHSHTATKVHLQSPRRY